MTRQLILCCAVLTCALLFKFWLIAPMEITDDTNDPARYVEQIRLHSGLCYGPGTGYAGGLFYAAGIPFRFGIEAAFLVAAFLVVGALFEWPTQTWRALAIYLVVTFNPAVEELLSHLMSDQVWLVETLLGLSLIVFFARNATKTRWLYILLAALSLGFSTVTRSTFVPLVVTFTVWALGSIAVVALSGRKLRLDYPALGGCFLCLYAVTLFYYATCFHNSKHNGYFGLCAFDSTEYRDFYTCLQSVGSPTGHAYYPIDDNRLKLIASAGPRSRWFVDQLARDTSFRQTSLQVYGRPGIALTWFHWAVFETVDTDGDLSKTFALFRDVEREIAQAAREGRLPVRSVLPLPDCRLPLVLGAIPDRFLHIASLIRQQPGQYAWDWGRGEPTFTDPEFTAALHRRAVTPSPIREKIGRLLCHIYSWMYLPLLPGLTLAVGAFGVVLVRHRTTFPFSFHFFAQQLFLVSFVVLLLWYLLFDASGLLAVPRYLIFNNAMLPVLFAYYISAACFRSAATKREYGPASESSAR